MRIDVRDNMIQNTINGGFLQLHGNGHATILKFPMLDFSERWLSTITLLVSSFFVQIAGWINLDVLVTNPRLSKYRKQQNHFQWKIYGMVLLIICFALCFCTMAGVCMQFNGKEISFNLKQGQCILNKESFDNQRDVFVFCKTAHETKLFELRTPCQLDNDFHLCHKLDMCGSLCGIGLRKGIINGYNSMATVHIPSSSLWIDRSVFDENLLPDRFYRLTDRFIPGDIKLILSGVAILLGLFVYLTNHTQLNVIYHNMAVFDEKHL